MTREGETAEDEQGGAGVEAGTGQPREPLWQQQPLQPQRSCFLKDRAPLSLSTGVLPSMILWQRCNSTPK